MSPIIDAHQHFWSLDNNDLPWLCEPEPIPFRYGDYSALRRNYLVPDYLSDARHHTVAGTVYVEAEWDRTRPNDETQWVAKTRQQTGLPSVMVAHAKLDGEGLEGVLERHCAYPFVRGIRHKPAASPTPAGAANERPGAMGDPKWRAGYALLHRFGLSFDLQTPWWHLAEAADLAKAFPDTPIILNHAGLPADRSPDAIAAWRSAMQTLAACPNAFAKISGIGVPGNPWTAALNKDIVHTTIDIFGIERCMFASNFPVDSLVADFDTIFGCFNALTQHLSGSDRRALFYENAKKLYRISDDDLVQRSPLAPR